MNKILTDRLGNLWIGSHYQKVLSPGTKIKILGIRE